MGIILFSLWSRGVMAVFVLENDPYYLYLLFLYLYGRIVWRSCWGLGAERARLCSWIE